MYKNILKGKFYDYLIYKFSSKKLTKFKLPLSYNVTWQNHLYTISFVPHYERQHQDCSYLIKEYAEKRKHFMIALRSNKLLSVILFFFSLFLFSLALAAYYNPLRYIWPIFSLKRQTFYFNWSEMKPEH